MKEIQNMKILNQAKSMNTIKLFFLIVFSFLTLLSRAQIPNNPTISCGKLNLTWTESSSSNTYTIQIFKNSSISVFKEIITSIPGVKTETFPSNTNEVLESGSYTFKVKNNNLGVYSLLSNPAATAYNPLSPTITNLCSNNFTLNWTRLESSSSCNTSITYKYYIYKYTNISGTVLQSGFTPVTGTTTNNTFTYNNAEPEGFYKIQVEAISNNGTSTSATGNTTYPSNLTFQTPAIPTTPINNIAFSNITCNSFNISWSALTGSCIPSAFTYRYTIYREVTYTNDYVAEFVGTTTNSVTSILYNSVLPSSYYKVQVEAVHNGTGLTLASSIYPNTTIGIQSSNIPDVNSFVVSNIATSPSNNFCTGISASWLKNDCATDYEIEVYNHLVDLNGIIMATYNIVGTSASVQTFTLASGLFPNNLYSFKIKAIKKVNNVVVANSNQVTQFLNTPNKITAPAITNIITCGRTVTITWTASTDLRAEGYLLDLSTISHFSAGNFVTDFNMNLPIQNFAVNGRNTNTYTFELSSFYPFVQRTIYFRICAKNINNTCNSDYSFSQAINLSENAASINPSLFTFNSPIETVNNVANSFKTHYISFGSPYQLSFLKDNCVVKCQVKVEMANANGTVFAPSGVAASATSWTGPQTTNFTNYLSGFFSDYIKNNGGTLCNYNGIGTTANLNASTTSLLLAPETKYGSQVLSTGYHKITLLFWKGTNTVPEEQSLIVKIFNVFDDFALQYPDQNGTGNFTNYYFNTSSSLYDFGPGFQCRQFNSIINAKSNTPTYSNFNFTPGYSTSTSSSWGYQNLYDFEHNQSIKVIFSKAINAEHFYKDASNVNQIIAEKTLTNNELWQLRIGDLNLIDVFNSLNVVGNINQIGINTGTSGLYNYLNNNTNITKIISFGYTAQPTNVQLVNKCANDITLKWTGNGNASGTVYFVTIGTSYDPASNTISNYVTSGPNGNLITYNNYQMSTNQFQALFNTSTASTYYVQVKAQKGSNCISSPSNIFSFPVYSTALRAPLYSNSTCFGLSIGINNLNYDLCVEKCSLEVQNLNDPSDKWIGIEESISSFITRLNNFNTTYVPFEEQYPTVTIQNYINSFRTSNGPNPFYQGYNGINNVSVGNLFKSFKGVSGSYRIRFVYKLTDGTYHNYDNTITITSPFYPVTMKTSTGNFSPSNVFNVPEVQGYTTKTIYGYANTRFLSATINPYYNYPTFPQNCIHSVIIDFSATLNGFNTISSIMSSNPVSAKILAGSDLTDFLSTGGLDLNNFYTSNGVSGANYIRITYTNNFIGKTENSAIYNFVYRPTALLYIRSNTAYETEKNLGFRDIVLEDDPTVVYTYDHNNHFYSNGTHVLIPDNINTTVPLGNFYGFMNGSPSSSNFQWDANLLDFSNRGSEYSPGWDKQNMFVSPFSIMPMNICEVLDVNNNGLSCTNSTLIDITNTVYSSNFNSSGNYVGTGTYTIDNLIMDQGLVDNGSDNDYIVQQSADDNSYCVQTYGYGWRLPTATEIGKELDLPVSTFSTNPAYYQNSTGKIWSSSLWQYNTSWWEAIGTTSNLNMLSNNSFYSTSNYVRCVYPTH